MVTEACTVLVSLTFLFTAVTKLRTRALFGEQIADYKLLPYWATRVAAIGVIAAELGTADASLIPVSHRAALVVAAGLVMVFTSAQVSLDLSRGLSLAKS